MQGPTAQNLITGTTGANATLENVNVFISGSGKIGQGDDALL